MPDDWFSPVLQFLSAIIWPVVALVMVFLFREPIRLFINEISEVTGLGASAKRSAIRRSEELRDSAQTEAEDEADVSDQADRRSEDPDPRSTTPTTPSLLPFVEKQIDSNLRWAQRNTRAASSAVCGEIVRSTYTDLRLGIRLVGYSLGGHDAVSGKNLQHVVPQIILRRVGAPPELIELVVQVRTFATQVRRQELKVNEQAAENFIDSLLDLNHSLFRWWEEAEAERPSLST